MLLLKYRR